MCDDELASHGKGLEHTCHIVLAHAQRQSNCMMRPTGSLCHAVTRCSYASPATCPNDSRPSDVRLVCRGCDGATRVQSCSGRGPKQEAFVEAEAVYSLAGARHADPISNLTCGSGRDDAGRNQPVRVSCSWSCSPRRVRAWLSVAGGRGSTDSGAASRWTGEAGTGAVHRE